MHGRDEKTHFMNIGASPLSIFVSLTTSMTFSTAFQYFRSPVRWLKYLNSSCRVATSAVLTHPLWFVSGIPCLRPRFTIVIGSPLCVSKTGMILSARSMAFSRYSESCPDNAYADSNPPSTRIVV